MSLGLFLHLVVGSAGYVGDYISSPSPSVHDPPGHAGTGGHCRRRVALAPLHQHRTQESLPECRVAHSLMRMWTWTWEVGRGQIKCSCCSTLVYLLSGQGRSVGLSVKGGGGLLNCGPGSSGMSSGPVVTLCVGQGRPDAVTSSWAVGRVCCYRGRSGAAVSGHVHSSSGNGNQSVSTDVSQRRVALGTSFQPGQAENKQDAHHLFISLWPPLSVIQVSQRTLSSFSFFFWFSSWL